MPQRTLPATDGAAPALSARGLRVHLGGVEVLHGVDVDLRAGRWTAVVGANGAGKTTLLKALAGLVPAAGSVALLGQTQRPARERARLLAWMGQAEGAAGDLLAQDVVMLGRLPHMHWLGGPAPADRAAVEAAMRETQCWEWRDRALASLSGGERQRVLLARALAVQAQVLLMDEPLANLDPPHQADWLATVRGRVAQGGTAVSVLHEVTMALQADDLLILREGRVVHQGAAADPATHAALEAAFAHRIEVHALGGRLVALPR